MRRGSRGIERGVSVSKRCEEGNKTGKVETVLKPTQGSIKKKERIIVKELGKENPISNLERKKRKDSSDCLIKTQNIA